MFILPSIEFEVVGQSSTIEIIAMVINNLRYSRYLHSEAIDYH